jgi:hypothetical protein
MKRTIFILTSTLVFATPGVGANIGPVNSADVTVYSYPDPPQDPNNLPTSPANVPVTALTYSQYGSTSIDQTFSGTAPKGPVGLFPNQYSMHILADATPTAVHAAFQTTYDGFQGSNLFPVFYQDAQGNVTTGQSLDSYLYTFMQETIDASGPGTGSYSLTLLLHLSGSNTNSWFYGGPGGPQPTTLGAFEAMIDEPTNSTGQVIEFRSDGSYNQDISVSLPVPLNSTAYFAYGFNFAQYAPEWGDLQLAENTFLAGSIDYSYASTAALDKIIVSLPAGSDPSQYTVTFGTGANYNVAFQVAPAAVPEPSGVLLLSLGLPAPAIIGWRRRVHRT